MNKVSSKVELNFDFEASQVLDPSQKEQLKIKLANRLTSGGLIQVISEEERSQYLNKERAIQKLYILLKNALLVQKPRKATTPKRAAIEKRLERKQKQAIKKLNRNRRDFDG